MNGHDLYYFDFLPLVLMHNVCVGSQITKYFTRLTKSLHSHGNKYECHMPVVLMLGKFYRYLQKEREIYIL